MKYRLKIIKKLWILFLIVQLSFESFAAIVADNDGAAFVTKAEFEALKNNFASQIENYNDSIDGKIDGAIASYLAGVNISKKQIKSLLIKDWDKYVMMNKSIPNDYVYPDFSGQYSLFKYATIADQPFDTTSWNTKIFFSRNTMNYTRSAQSQKKVLVDNVVVGSTLNIDNVTWAGIALNAREKYNLNRQDLQQSFDDGDPAYLFADEVNELILCNAYDINLDGYITNLNSISSLVWGLNLRWTWSGSSSNGKTNWLQKPVFVSNEANISYEKNAEGNTYDYLHVGNWLGTTAWECNAKGVNNYFKTSTNNSLRTGGWVHNTSAVNSGMWDGIEASNANYYNSTGATLRIHLQRGAKFSQATTIRDNNNADSENNHTIPTIGLIGNINAGNIYQYNKKSLYDEDGAEINRVTMQQGIPVMQVKEDEIVEWTAKFKNIDSSLTNKYIAVMLSYVPFSNDSTLTTNTLKDFVMIDFTDYDTTKYGRYLKGTEDGKSYYFPVTDRYNTTTKSCEVPIKFEADRSGLVYLKFFVYDGTNASSISSSWEATLDISNSNSYTSIR